jgi:hypothetical protein
MNEYNCPLILLSNVLFTDHLQKPARSNKIRVSAIVSNALNISRCKFLVSEKERKFYHKIIHIYLRISILYFDIDITLYYNFIFL